MSKRKRRDRVESEKRKILLQGLLDKWVCLKYISDGEERYIYIKHKLREESSVFKIEQIILSDDPAECGVYYITDFEINKVLDYVKNKEIIEMNLIRFNQEIGLNNKKIKTYNELLSRLVEQNYLTDEEIQKYTNHDQKPPGLEEISFG